MSSHNQMGDITVVGGDFTGKNYSTTLTIAAGTAVLLDTSAANGIPASTAIGVVAPTTSGSVAACIGVAVESILPGKTGRIRALGGAVCTAYGSITVGDMVVVSSTSSHEGQVATAGSGAVGFGKALSTAADGDSVLVWVGCFAKNA